MSERSVPSGPVDRTLLVDRVRQSLYGEIVAGAWPVGSKLPTESELVTWSGAGRNTVREAVGSLVQAGVLRREQGRGTFVASISDFDGPLGRRAAQTSRRDALELRLALDAAAARIAATRRTPDEAAALSELLDERARSWDSDAQARARADTALHTAIVAATRNALLQEVYASLTNVFEDVVLEDVQADQDLLDEQHARLVAAIQQQQPDQAVAAMVSLLQPLIDQLDDAPR